MAKHTVILKEDAKKYLSMKSQYRLKMMIDAINLGRESDGRNRLRRWKSMIMNTVNGSIGGDVDG